MSAKLTLREFSDASARTMDTFEVKSLNNSHNRLVCINEIASLVTVWAICSSVWLHPILQTLCAEELISTVITLEGLFVFSSVIVTDSALE